MKLYLAPLHGITTHTFRRVYSRHFTGFDALMAPFITTVRAERVAESHLRDVMPENNRGIPLIPQVIGNVAEEITQLTRAFNDLGYAHVNLNLGCPFVKVARKGRGSGLLPHTDRVVAILEQVTRSTTGSFSIKARLGMNNKEDLPRLLPLLKDIPIEHIIIHPRTGTQEYEGVVDLNAFEKCCSLTAHRIVFNGDILTRKDFTRMNGRFGDRIAGWMIGRGALCNPFLPWEIRNETPVTSAEAIPRIRAYVNDLYSENRTTLDGGPMPLLNRMKEFWGYLSQSFGDGKKLLKEIQKTKKTEEYERIIEEFFESKPVWHIL